MKGAEVQTETRDSQENVGFGFISREIDRLAKRKKKKGYQLGQLIPALSVIPRTGLMPVNTNFDHLK